MSDERQSAQRDIETKGEPDEKRVTVFDPARRGAETPLWKLAGSSQIADCRIFRVRRDDRTDPRNGRTHDFYCLDMPDWINVIPVTARGEVVMIEQYRHGTDSVTLEIPGGVVDPGEEPRATALRELTEETGYRAASAELLGSLHPNPAIQGNMVHTYFCENVEYESAPIFDSTEHIAVRLVALDRVPALIADGTITHALVIAGFYWLSLRLNRMLES
jgi:8-oxo-dGTP pyrophosphatase MutT (NUDIX family)